MSMAARRSQKLGRLIIGLAMVLLLVSRFTIACEAAMAAVPAVQISVAHDCEGGSAPVDHPATKLPCAGVCAAMPAEVGYFAIYVPAAGKLQGHFAQAGHGSTPKPALPPPRGT